MFSSLGRGRNFLVYGRNPTKAFEASRSRGDPQDEGQDVNCLKDGKTTALWLDEVSLKLRVISSKVFKCICDQISAQG